MKFRRRYILMILAVTAVSSCSDSADLDGSAAETVSVDLSLSVSSQSRAAGSRLSPAIVQDNTTFRGMQDLIAIPFGVKRAVGATDLPKAYTTQGVATHSTDRQTSQQAWFYYFSGCQLTTGTASFLAYGRAVPALSPDEPGNAIANKAYNGALVRDVNAAEQPSTYTFSLEPIVQGNNAPSQASLLAVYLTEIARTGAAGNVYNTERAWATTTEPSLKALFLSFTNQSNDGAHHIAGSSRNVAAHVAALRQMLDGITVVSDDHQALLAALRTAAAADLPVSCQNYPASVGLPDGAAALIWNGSAFVTVTETNTVASITNISRYAYPAELCYYGNSQLYASNSEVTAARYDAAADWTTVLDGYEYKSAAEVSHNTQAVALVEPLQYAVACLKLNIKDTETTLHDAVNTAVTVGEETFPMTAVIVGGQLPLGFDFRPKEPYSELEARFVYDHHVLDEDGHTIYLRAGSGVSNTTSTLVLQSYDGKDVPVVLEFINNSDRDFMGVNGKIYRGTRFYLVGVIDPATASDGQNAATEGRVFTQDHTTALTVKVASLAKAYNVLPDLLTPRLEVGVQFISQWVQATPTDVQLQ